MVCKCSHINTLTHTHMHTQSRSWLKTEVSRETNCCHHTRDMSGCANRERMPIHTFAWKTNGRNLPQTLPQVFTDMFPLRDLWRQDALTSGSFSILCRSMEKVGKLVVDLFYVSLCLCRYFCCFFPEMNWKTWVNSYFYRSDNFRTSCVLLKS